MPPKKSDLIHVTFHFYRSAVLLSVSHSTTIQALKQSLLPALTPLQSIIPNPPNSISDIRLYEEKPLIEGAEATENLELRSLEDTDKKTTLLQLGWGGWKKVFVSFKEDGTFSDPVFTIPDVDDEEPAEDS